MLTPCNGVHERVEGVREVEVCRRPCPAVSLLGAPSLKSSVPMRVSTLSGVVIVGGIALAGWAVAKRGSCQHGAGYEDCQGPDELLHSFVSFVCGQDRSRVGRECWLGLGHR